MSTLTRDIGQVDVISPGRLVRVSSGDAGKLTDDDVMELAAVLIEEHGHIAHDSGDTARGFSIHGAVGEAAKRATGSGAKDDANARPFRDRIAKRINEVHGQTEQDLSDHIVQSPGDAARILRESKRRVPAT